MSPYNYKPQKEKDLIVDAYEWYPYNNTRDNEHRGSEFFPLSKPPRAPLCRITRRNIKIIWMGHLFNRRYIEQIHLCNARLNDAQRDATHGLMNGRHGAALNESLNKAHVRAGFSLTPFGYASWMQGCACTSRLLHSTTRNIIKGDIVMGEKIERNEWEKCRCVHLGRWSGIVFGEEFWLKTKKKKIEMDWSYIWQRTCRGHYFCLTARTMQIYIDGKNFPLVINDQVNNMRVNHCYVKLWYIFNSHIMFVQDTRQFKKQPSTN